MVDWTLSLEAVRKATGETVPVTLMAGRPQPDGGMYRTNESPGYDTNKCWYADGSDYCQNDAWFVRNVGSLPAAYIIGGDLRRPSGDWVTTEDEKRYLPFTRASGRVEYFSEDDLEGRKVIEVVPPPAPAPAPAPAPTI